MKFYTEELLSAKRTTGDPDADSFIEKIFSDKEEKSKLFHRLQNLKLNSQVEEFKEAYAQFPLFNYPDKLPDWANGRQMVAATAFFAKHAQVVLNMLGLLSLPYCYAAANGCMVLYLSDRMRGDIGKRLTETGEFVWDVMAPQAFTEIGNGFAAIIKVRLMHAAVRYYTLRNPGWNSAFGSPVNQEDMAGTNLSFSLIVVRGLRKFGFSVSYNDQQSFMHLWNVIGSLLGVNTDLLPENGKLAFELEESVRLRQFTPSVQGRELTGSLISYFKLVNKGGQVSNAEISPLIRYLVGNSVADIIGLPAVSLAPAKIGLLRTINFLTDINKQTNTITAYAKGLSFFRKTHNALLKH